MRSLGIVKPADCTDNWMQEAEVQEQRAEAGKQVDRQAVGGLPEEQRAEHCRRLKCVYFFQ